MFPHQGSFKSSYPRILSKLEKTSATLPQNVANLSLSPCLLSYKLPTAELIAKLKWYYGHFLLTQSSSDG
jgi:hypothetical protein